MNKLSVKLGVLFFFIIFGLMVFMFFFLHQGIADARVEEELKALQARGNSHRDVLEKHFVEETIHHVVLMESESTTDVVITDVNGKILDASSSGPALKNYLKIPPSPIPQEGQIIEENWQEEPYIVTASPITIDGKLFGFVYMFENTSSVHSLMQSLNEHFRLAGWVSILLTMVIIIFLSSGITRPLIKMTEATSQISKGNFAVSLPKTSDDELGDLAKSIEILAADLNYLKEERSEFLASISHELRTPLTYIKGYADILQKRDLPAEERQKYLKIIIEESNTLTGLIKELFELAKIDRNAFDIHKEQLDLRPFFNKIEQKLAPAFHDRNIELEVYCQDGILLRADPFRLEQILINLLDNSLKYSKAGASIKLQAWNSKGFIHIKVKDTGKGIPEKDLPYIFNRFYRVDKSRTRSLGGTGLGLAIVQELVHAHGAKISVQSKEGIGTEFEIIFEENKP